ncbi:MAG TPA: hypothetical protein VKW04_15000 [Planctomycetota bacterium]|jgi:hypothetical protein|nr:hypothetical protein [Planctomycetota bacterium]
MTRPRLHRVLMVLLPLSMSGCAMLGAGGSLIGSLFMVALYLAAIAAPILLSYYLYKHQL